MCIRLKSIASSPSVTLSFYCISDIELGSKASMLLISQTRISRHIYSVVDVRGGWGLIETNDE